MRIRMAPLDWAMFSLLCGLIASEWLLPVDNAGRISSLQLEGLAYGVIGIGALAFGWGISGLRIARWWRLGLASVLFFAIPSILLEAVNGWIASTGVSALFAVTPVVVVLVVASGAGGPRDGGDLRRLFVPALMGLGGVLCVLPFGLPASPREWLAFGVVLIAVVLVGAAGVWMHLLLGDAGWLEGIAVVGVCSAVALLAWCGVRGELVFSVAALREEVSVRFGVRVIEILLLLWLLRTIDPIRLSSRYLVISIVTIVEGLALLRPSLTARFVTGVVLLVVGAGWLLASRAREAQPQLTLR